MVLIGCAGTSRRITAFEASGACQTATVRNDESGGCQYQQDHCDNIDAVVESEHANLAACEAACRQADDEFFPYATLTNCRDVFRVGQRWCQRYCRTNYTAAGPLPPSE